MEPQLAYLKSVIEGVPDIEAWKAWFERNDADLQKLLPRTKYLDLKLNRIRAIPAVLAMNGIMFEVSERYAYLGGVEGRCRDCGAAVEHAGAFTWCPNGCFRMHVLRRPGGAGRPADGMDRPGGTVPVE
jgi:hypothetical protein